MPQEIYRAFAEKGLEVVNIPLIRTIPKAYHRLEQDYDWIFFTSVNAVKYFDFEQLNQRSKILAIGNQTAKTLQELGFSVDFQPKEGVSEGIVREWLAYSEPQQRVFWPHSHHARRVIYDELTSHGHLVFEREIYRNEFFPEDQERLRKLLLDHRPLDYVLFASPSAWDSFSRITETIRPIPADFWSRLKIAAIGPVTTKAIQKERVVAIQPAIYDMPHLYECLLKKIEDGE